MGAGRRQRAMTRSESESLVAGAGLTEQELATLLGRHGPSVRRWIAPRLPRRWRAMLSVDDIMQQAYTDAFLALPHLRYTNERRFLAWLRKVAESRLTDAVRMLTAERRGTDRRRSAGTADGATQALVEALAAAGTTPSQHVARREWRAQLSAALERLPDDYRRVIVLYDLEQRPIKEVARLLGRSAGAVFNMRARARRRLAGALGQASAYMSSG